jgi:hypothetical protein
MLDYKIIIIGPEDEDEETPVYGDESNQDNYADQLNPNNPA